MNCIYCKKPIFGNKNKTKEHIFLKSFGCPDDFVIHCVCYECNNNFGKTIDRWFSYDSFEGVKRLRLLGSKSKQGLKHYKRLSINLPYDEQFGDFQGTIVQIDIDNPEELVLPNQVGLLNKSKKYEYITLNELENTKNLDDRLKNYSFKKEKIKILSKNDTELAKSLKKLEKLKIKGPKFKVLDKRFGFPGKPAKANSKIWVKIKGIIDKEILRVIAKIAFNYLAFSKGEEYVLQDKFDDTREFIRTGKNEKNVYFVLPNAKHILSNEFRRIKFFEGFLVNIERERNNIVSRVSLFNDLTYKVILSINSENLWLPNFNIGHSFDYKRKELKKLKSVDSSFIKIVG